MGKSNNSRKGVKKGNRRMSPSPKKMGNSSKICCTFCNPKLSAKVANKQIIAEEQALIQRELKNIISLCNYSQ